MGLSKNLIVLRDPNNYIMGYNQKLVDTVRPWPKRLSPVTRLRPVPRSTTWG